MAALSSRSGVISVVVLIFGSCASMDVIRVPEQMFGDGNSIDSNKPLESVGLMWGIPDITAAVGHVFRFHIPSDAFKGSIKGYKVAEAGKDVLPSWLQLDSAQHVLQGIPTPTDKGQHYLEVIAHGLDGSVASDVFSVFVNPDTPNLSPAQPITFRKSGPELVRCKREESETVATIHIDVDFEKLPVDKRLNLVQDLLSYMGLSEEMVKITPVDAKQQDEASTLVTGVGDAKEPKFSGLAVSWLVGCGKVEPGHFTILEKLDSHSANGMIAKAVGHPVVKWKVSNSRLRQQTVKRKRRQVRTTPTPVITISPPTATDKDTGATDVDTMTRKVVDMASPAFTIQPTPTEPLMPMTKTPTPPATTVRPDEVTKTEALPTASKSPLPVPPTKKPPATPQPECLKPEVANPIGNLNFLVGEVVNYKIPENTFTACGLGGTSSLKLTLFLETSKRIPEDHWLQFDAKTQTMRGLPLDEHKGRTLMTLVAMFDGGVITTDMIRIQVKQPSGKKAKINHELSMTFDADYDTFVSNIDHKLNLTKKIANVFGDENASAITVLKLSRGSLIYSYTNNTLSGGTCPADSIKSIADKIVKDGQLHPEALAKLKPWTLSGFQTAPEGDCVGDPNFPSVSVKAAMPPQKPDPDAPMTKKPTMKPEPETDSAMTDKPDKAAPATVTPAPATVSPTRIPPTNTTTEAVAKGSKTSEDDIWITTVVPAVVIVAILLLALLIACILYRKKRKGKMTLEDKNTFVNKGAPVIFPDELDDRPNDSTKPLLIEGNPPAPPPEYHRGTSESPERRNISKDSTPPINELEADIEDTDVTSRLYQPPPPVTASSGKQVRPHVQQPYRSQAPEIRP